METRRQENKMTSGKVEKLKSEKGDNPLLNLPPKRGEKQRGDFALSTCQLFNLSTKRGKGFGHLNFGNLNLFRISDFELVNMPFRFRG
ncbi:MAG: hypothetical protein J7L42_05675 [Elusimicrobia bacterium]|nr:hypothetical protein [Elusimicrobiota bacterium]